MSSSDTDNMSDDLSFTTAPSSPTSTTSRASPTSTTSRDSSPTTPTSISSRASPLTIASSPISTASTPTTPTCDTSKTSSITYSASQTSPISVTSRASPPTATSPSSLTSPFIPIAPPLPPTLLLRPDLKTQKESLVGKLQRRYLCLRWSWCAIEDRKRELEVVRCMLNMKKNQIYKMDKVQEKMEMKKRLFLLETEYTDLHVSRTALFKEKSDYNVRLAALDADWADAMAVPLIDLDQDTGEIEKEWLLNGKDPWAR